MNSELVDTAMGSIEYTLVGAGSGGSFGWADPITKVGYGYVTNQAGYYHGNDPRDVALRKAFHQCIGQTIII